MNNNYIRAQLHKPGTDEPTRFVGIEVVGGHNGVFLRIDRYSYRLRGSAALILADALVDMHETRERRKRPSKPHSTTR